MLEHSDLAPGLLLGEAVEIGPTVELGVNVVIHSGTKIGLNCKIGDGAVLGKQPVLRQGSSAESSAELLPLTLNESTKIGTQAVVFAGSAIGRACTIGDQSFVRERSRIGSESLVGRGSAVDNDVTVGERVLIQTNCYITAFTVIEDDVFVGPGVVTSNDDTMSRHGSDYALKGALLRRACRVGAGAVLVPGVEIGEEAYVAAGAVVSKSVEPFAVVMGVPASPVRKVSDQDLLENWC